MDVDPVVPSSVPPPGSGSGGHVTQGTSGGGATLKRSSSAPMINELVSQAQVISSASAIRCFGSPPMFSLSTHHPSQMHSSTRMRRFSATFSPLVAPPGSPGSSSGVRTPSRLMQIRQEEGLLEDREIRHERNVHAQLQMSQSCEDLTLTSVRTDEQKRRSITDPLHLTLPQPGPALLGSSPSPTRAPPTSRNCFSPSLQMPLRSHPFSPSPSPSPTRRTFATRRSMSPITLRPSPLGAVKRKCDYDTDAPAGGGAKRFHSGGHAPSAAGGLLAPHPLLFSSSSSEAGLGHLQGSVGSVGTPESVSSVGSPGLSYKHDDSPRHLPQDSMDSSSLFRPVESPRSSERRLKAEKMDDSCVPMETGSGGDKLVAMEMSRPVAMETGGTEGKMASMDTGGTQRVSQESQYMRQSI